MNLHDRDDDDRMGAIDRAVERLEELYNSAFRGKERGRFTLTREQLRTLLEVQRLHPPRIQRFQDAALARGYVVIDLDDVFPVLRERQVRRYRRPPRTLFNEIIEADAEPAEDVDEDEDAEDID